MIRGRVEEKPDRVSKKGFTSIQKICEPFWVPFLMFQMPKKTL